MDSKTTVLIAEDSAPMREDIVQILKSFGYAVVQVADGMEAWDALNDPSIQFDVILSDWNMPRMQGIELLHRVRSADRLKNTPFIMISSRAEESMLISAIQSGVDNYLTKPFTPDVLKAKLEKAFSKRKAS